MKHQRISITIKNPLNLSFLILNKRQKIITTAVVLALGLLATGFIPVSFYLTYKFYIIAGYVFLAYVFSLWALWEGINKLKALILMILPVTFALAISSYYFLLPFRWLTRLPVAIIFGLIWYTLLLSQNVFNVSSIRTIPLYRVASTVIFVLTLITASLLFNVIFSLHLLFFWNGVVAFLLSFILILQVAWSVNMEGLTSLIIFTSLILALVVGEIALALSFWPISNAMASVVLTASLYIALGITTDSLRERLSREVVWGYIRWGLPIFILAFLTTSWTG